MRTDMKYFSTLKLQLGLEDRKPPFEYQTIKKSILEWPGIKMIRSSTYTLDNLCSKLTIRKQIKMAAILFLFDFGMVQTIRKPNF